MPKTRAQKETIVAELADKLSRIKSAVFTSISGYTMDDANALRAKGREQGVEAIVAKKTLLVKALEKNNLPVASEELQGSILTTIGYDDEVTAAKLIAGLIKDREGIKILGGILEGRYVGADVIKQLSSLPNKEELYAKVVGSLNAPVSGFVNALAGNLRNLVYVLNAVKDLKPNI
ncbi:50S ribosomal protein L10 [Candidatus Uhrbacteria bacterium]|nr:50S ribosomal protein L10 [Candidatus Uhrbacteria bacterium]